MIIIDVPQNTPEWHAARLGIPTASMASSLLTSKLQISKSLDGYARKLACDKFAGENIDAWQGNAYTDRGHEIEAEAAMWYSLQADTDLEFPGFITNDAGTYGASPDAWIPGVKTVEIKCLPKQHFDALIYFDKHNKPPTANVMQCHFAMLVAEVDQCDLVYYHPKLPKQTITIERDTATDVALVAAINQCLVVRDEYVHILERQR